MVRRDEWVGAMNELYLWSRLSIRLISVHVECNM